VPTSDAKVKETCEVLSKAHPLIVALVDGDDDGGRYADALDEPDAGARKVLRWPDGWTIEDVVGWIIDADAGPVIARLGRDLAPAPSDVPTLVARLKSDDRTQNGLKGDGVAYEIIANALSERPACRVRARKLLHAMAEACASAQTPHFTADARASGRIPRLVFTP
jgi:putative ATP-dependent endonuclease of the OLD family